MTKNSGATLRWKWNIDFLISPKNRIALLLTKSWVMDNCLANFLPFLIQTKCKIDITIKLQANALLSVVFGKATLFKYSRRY